MTENIFYTINYGYIEGVMAADGEEQDTYILGIDKPIKELTGKIISIIHRKDDIEDKRIVAPEGMGFTVDEIKAAVWFQEQYFDIKIII